MKKRELMVCPKCGRLANARVKSTNHPFHFIMSILTVGFWLPIWLLCVIECMFHRPKIVCDCAKTSRYEKRWEGQTNDSR